VIAHPATWEALAPAKLIPSPDSVPDRFEFGTLSFELLAGVTAAVNFLAGLAAGPSSSRRDRLVASMTAAAAYEKELADRMLAGLSAIPSVTVCPAPDQRCPTISFRVQGQDPAATARALGDRGICVYSGDYYAHEYFAATPGGAVRASIYHYNTRDEVDRFLATLAGRE
jgi:selenocysteine lyase/cysteine desulfurase